jgi:hypothetical protein
MLRFQTFDDYVVIEDFSLYWSFVIILNLQLCSLHYHHFLSFYVLSSTHLFFQNYRSWSTTVRKQPPKDPKLCQLILPQLASRPHLAEYHFFHFRSFFFYLSRIFLVFKIQTIRLLCFFSRTWKIRRIKSAKE